MLANRISEVQAALAEADIDGWFFLCFQKNDPVALTLLGLEDRFLSRRCYYFVPREGAPRRLVHGIEPAMLDHLPGSSSSYTTWGENRAAIGELLSGAKRVAAQWSPGCVLPAVSRLDAGTADLVRSFGVELVSSAELIQRFAATWTPDQLAGHRRACTHLHEVAQLAFAKVAAALRADEQLDEHAVQQWILAQFEQRGLHCVDPPIVGVNAHSADPHYMPGPVGSDVIRRGDFLLIDLWAKEQVADSVYADITWCGVCAAAPTEHQAAVFALAARGRDAGVELLRQRWPHTPVAGYEVDDAVRGIITAGGYGPNFIHRTGHSIHTSDHGPGANIDNLETHDTRRLIAMTGFSIEPGIYLPGNFGVRTEINIALTDTAVEVTGGTPQRELLSLLA